MEHLNLDVSVLNRLNIRYEGKLAIISTQHCCIQINSVSFKGLENRPPPEPIEETPDPTGLESLKFYDDEIANISVLALDAGGKSTQTDVTSQILSVFAPKGKTDNELKTDNNDTDEAVHVNSDFLFSIGVIADPQYADSTARFNYAKNAIRRYRNGLQITAKAVKVWTERDRPLLVACLGDIIDGHNQKKKTSTICMERILSVFKQFTSQVSTEQSAQLLQNIAHYPLDCGTQFQMKDCAPKFPFFHNVIGNHELYNFDQQQLMQYFYSPSVHDATDQNWNCVQCSLINAKNTSQCQACFKAREHRIMTPRFYYALSPFPGYVFIFLNCYEITALRYDYYDYSVYNQTLHSMDSSYFNLKQHQSQSQANLTTPMPALKNGSKLHPNKQIAMDLLRTNNNGDIYGVPHTMDDRRRFTIFNGGFGAQQLNWLKQQLEQIEKMQTKHNVILFGHIPIWCKLFTNPKTGLTGNERTICWDYKEINAIIAEHECVKMYIAGHNHDGECVRDSNGVWHRTLEGAIEAPLDSDCFGTLYFYKDKAVLKGYGMRSDVFPFR